MERLVKQLKINKSKGEALYLQIEKSIAQMIRKNNLAAGDKIPSPNEIAGHLSVSPLTIRKAVARLADRGLLVTRHGRGTFVGGASSLEKVLFVCGINIFEGDVSPFFTHVLGITRRECNKKGLHLEPVWLSSDDIQQSSAYCTPASTEKYRGHIFIDCGTDHPVLEYVTQRNLPRVSISADPSHVYRVSSDHVQGVKLGIDYLIERGHKEITIIDLPGFTPYVREALSESKVAWRLIEVPHLSRMSEYERNGYYVGRELISKNALPQAVFVGDDILARGISRAILESGNHKNMDLVVRCGRQEKPATGIKNSAFVVDDTHELTRQAVRILEDQIRQPSGLPLQYTGQYSLIRDSEESHNVKSNAGTAKYTTSVST